MYYRGCAAVDLDPTPGGLQDLVEIENPSGRTTKTLAYLRAQKTWPPVAASPSTPSPHRAPLMVTWERDRLVRAPLAHEVEADPARLLQQALAALRNRLADLASLRTTLSNQRPGLARAFSGLDLALAPDLAEINQIDIGEQILRIASLLPAPGEMLDDQLEDLLGFVDAAQRLARRLPDWIAYLDSDIGAELTAEAVKETMPLLTELASALREQSWVDDEVARDLDRQITTSQDLPRDARIGKGTQLSMSNVLNAALSGLSDAWTLLKRKSGQSLAEYSEGLRKLAVKGAVTTTASTVVYFFAQYSGAIGALTARFPETYATLGRWLTALGLS